MTLSEGKRVHFNDVLEVGLQPPFQLHLWGKLYPITCHQGNWKSVPQQGVYLGGVVTASISRELEVFLNRGVSL